MSESRTQRLSRRVRELTEQRGRLLLQQRIAPKAAPSGDPLWLTALAIVLVLALFFLGLLYLP